MSTYIHKSHKVSVLLFHAVCPTKYRRVVFDGEVDAALREVCLEIAANVAATEEVQAAMATIRTTDT